jgi:hypothetical protein
MKNYSKNTAIAEVSARRDGGTRTTEKPPSPLGRSATKQLSLFVDPPTFKSDLPPNPLQIKAISYHTRVKPNKAFGAVRQALDFKSREPDRYCKLVHYESGLNIPGQFTYDEAKEILLTTRYWDWELDRNRIPRCVERLLPLLENICARSPIGGEADA